MAWNFVLRKDGAFDEGDLLLISGMKKTFLTSLALAGFAFADSTVVFVGSGSDGIYTLKLDETSGALTDRQQPVKGNDMSFQELRSDGKVIFSTKSVEKAGGAASFSVEGAKLTLLSEQSYEGRGLCHVSLDRKDGVLFGADYGGGKVVSFPVGQDGKIGPVASLFTHVGSSVNPQRQKEPHAHSVFVGPDNKFAYAPDLGMDQVKFYSFDATSAVMKDEGGFAVPAGSGCRHMKFGKEGQFAYVLNEFNLTVTTFARSNKTGRLTQLKTVSVLPKGGDASEMSCSEIRVSQDGKFLYTANRDLTEKKRDSVSVLKVGAEGALDHVQTAPAEVWIPRNINLSPSGDWLLVAGQNSHEVTSHKVDQKTGKLTFSGHRVEVPTAMCINFAKSVN